MSYTIGVVLAIGVGILATVFGLDRDRAMYPIVMIVIAFYYVLFALIGGTRQTLLIELGVASVFIILSFAGFKSTLWLVVLALAGHGVLDLFHPALYANAGVPVWWPSFCMAYDIVAAVYLGWLLTRERVRAKAS
jgi:hypothetical protein